MPHRLIEDRYCTSDTVYEHPLFSASFILNGKRIFITQSHDDYVDLKREVTVTHRILGIEPCGGLHKCEMIGSDGSLIVFYLSDDDVHHNMQYTAMQMEIETLPMIC